MSYRCATFYFEKKRLSLSLLSVNEQKVHLAMMSQPVVSSQRVTNFLFRVLCVARKRHQIRLLGSKSYNPMKNVQFEFAVWLQSKLSYFLILWCCIFCLRRIFVPRSLRIIKASFLGKVWESKSSAFSSYFASILISKSTVICRKLLSSLKRRWPGGRHSSRRAARSFKKGENERKKPELFELFRTTGNCWTQTQIFCVNFEFRENEASVGSWHFCFWNCALDPFWSFKCYQDPICPLSLTLGEWIKIFYNSNSNQHWYIRPKNWFSFPFWRMKIEKIFAAIFKRTSESKKDVFQLKNIKSKFGTSIFKLWIITLL